VRRSVIIEFDVFRDVIFEDSSSEEWDGKSSSKDMIQNFDSDIKRPTCVPSFGQNKYILSRMTKLNKVIAVGSIRLLFSFWDNFEKA